jgi:hypothetical protein
VDVRRFLDILVIIVTTGCLAEFADTLTKIGSNFGQFANSKEDKSPCAGRVGRYETIVSALFTEDPNCEE